MFKKYQRTQIAELRPYIPGEPMAGISISIPDLENGSPKPGDMIARNPQNHEDQWLVAEQYFKDNFAPVDTALEAKLAARTGGVKVKALEWEDADEGMCTKWRAAALGGHYELVAFEKEPGFAVNFHWGMPLSFWFIQGEPDEWGPTGPKMFRTLEAAKSAAQADFERRILSALSLAPEAQQEPEGQQELVVVSLADIETWRSEWLIENDPQDGTDCVTPFDKYLYTRPSEQAVTEAQQEPVAWRWRTIDAETWVYDPSTEWLQAHGRNPNVVVEPLFTRPAEQAVTEAMIMVASDQISEGLGAYLRKFADSDAAKQARYWLHKMPDTEWNGMARLLAEEALGAALKAAMEAGR